MRVLGRWNVEPKGAFIVTRVALAQNLSKLFVYEAPLYV